jgi:hypothetical protein
LGRYATAIFGFTAELEANYFSVGSAGRVAIDRRPCATHSVRTNAIAEDVAVLDHDVADIDANPKAHPSPLRLIFVGPLKRRLDFDGATSCVEDAREFGEHAIDGCVRDPTSMPGD